MKRLAILKVTLKDGYIDIEGVELIELSEAEYFALKDVLDSEGYKSLECD